MHEYFPNEAKHNSVVANNLWSLYYPKHRCIYAPIAFERLFSAGSCSGNYKINADVTGIVTDRKNPALRLGSFNLTQAIA
jgi:hypothetical protein